MFVSAERAELVQDLKDRNGWNQGSLEGMPLKVLRRTCRLFKKHGQGDA